MKKLVFAVFLFPFLAHATVLAPSGEEVRFETETELQTADLLTPAQDLALRHARYLFSALQNPAVGSQFGLPARISGIGAPRWAPEARVTRDRAVAGLRTVRYVVHGKLLLHKQAAARLLQAGSWDITLPYDVDHFYDQACGDPGYPNPEQFWYFFFPFQAGCERFRAEPMAKPARLRVLPNPNLDPARPVGLRQLRSRDVIRIATINGFDESSTKRTDNGRVNFMAMNAWLREQGFRMTILSHFRNRPVYLFEKELTRADGTTLSAQVTRLLVDTDVDGSREVTFAKFLREALKESDVVVYEGHSGVGANLDLAQIERLLTYSRDPGAPKSIEFDRTKPQLFFFDACSSYSYYLSMFDGRKDPGTLAVLSNGLESEFGYELPMTKHLYTALLDLSHARVANDDLTWGELLDTMEKPLRGGTFLLNVDLN